MAEPPSGVFELARARESIGNISTPADARSAFAWKVRGDFVCQNYDSKNDTAADQLCIATPNPLITVPTSPAPASTGGSGSGSSGSDRGGDNSGGGGRGAAVDLASLSVLGSLTLRLLGSRGLARSRTRKGAGNSVGVSAT